MIKANELRIGNSIDIDGNIHKVDAVIQTSSDSGFELYVDGIDYDYAIYAKQTPLTKEWLLKLGFETTDAETDYMEWSIGDFSIGNKGGLDGYQDHDFYFEYGMLGTKKVIKYVHELQNLYFALTGQELTLSKSDKK